jgi:hypothetical protein
MFSSLEVRWILTCEVCPLATPLLSCVAIVRVCKEGYWLYMPVLEALRLREIFLELAKLRPEANCGGVW